MKLLLASVFATIISFNMPDGNNSGSFSSGNQSSKPIFSFGVISDVQYRNSDPVGTRFYRSSAGKLREAMHTFESGSVRFVINLGDLIDGDFGSFKPVMDIIDSSGLRTYHVAGNHDYAVDKRFKKKLPVHGGSKEGYYSFSYENFRFIILNGNELSTYISGNKATIKKAGDYLAELKNKGEINAVEWNGGLSSRQIEWLKGELDDAVSKDEKVFLICHFPIVPDNIHNLLNYKEVLPILENYHNIIAWLNGHNHAGNYGNVNMIHFVTFKGMVETDSTNSYSIVDVYKNKLWIRGFGREKSQILAY